MARPKRQLADWEAIEREYRAGQVSIVSLAKANGITEGAVRKRAKLNGWVRALGNRIREAVQEELTRGTDDGTKQLRDDEIVRTHAAIGADVVRHHRHAIGRGRDLTLRLLDELDAATTKVGELQDMIEAETAGDKTSQRRNVMMRAVELPSRAGVIKDLSAAAKNWVALERQAFNLGDDGGADEPATKADVKSALSKLNQGQRDSLRDIATALVGGAAVAPSGA